MTDERMDIVIAGLLRAGVTISAALVLAGGAWYLRTSAGQKPDFRHFHPVVRGFASLGALDWSLKMIMIGLLALIATPVARVVFSVAAFAAQRDRMYVWITVAVLAVLLYSIGTALF